jgi:hypothetical protein
MNARLVGQLTAQDNADQAPTEAMLAGYTAACRDLRTAVTTWAAIGTKGLAGLNAVLVSGGLQPIVEAVGLKGPDCGEKAGQSAAPTPRNR